MISSHMYRKKLKIGLLLNHYLIPAWSYQMIQKIIDSDYAEIELILINNELVSELQRPPFIEKILNIVYAKAIERKTYVRNAYELVDSSYLLNNISKVELGSELRGGKNSESSADLENIMNFNLDVIVNCGLQRVTETILSFSKLGVWSYQCDEKFEDKLTPIGHWESLEGWPVTKSSVKIQTVDNAEGKQIYSSFSCTDTMSIQDNKSAVAWKSLAFLPRMLKQLHRLGDKAFLQKMAEKQCLKADTNNSYRKPSSVILSKIIFSKILEKLAVVISNKFYFNQWILMFNFEDNDFSRPSKFRKLMPPKDRFWADPHVIVRNNKYYIFVEEFIYKNNLGHISLIIMDQDGTCSEAEKVLEKPYHLSYPHVFEHEGSFYMIPETMDNNTIELYECKEFPFKWEFKMNLMDNVKAVDATTLYHNNKWWLFVNMIETEGTSTWDELFLFSSDTLFTSDWQAHPLNPIISDCQISRPAGKFFQQGGKLYRPSQNCSKRYGYGYNINEVVELDESNYKEVPIKKVVADWDKKIIGTHTYSKEQSLKIIDALQRRRI